MNPDLMHVLPVNFAPEHKQRYHILIGLTRQRVDEVDYDDSMDDIIRRIVEF